MKIIKAGYEILDELDGQGILKKIEKCGRVCYKSEDKITDESAERFVQNIIKRGHESVLEHFSFTVKFVCDRGISHEIVRHRLASYSQESSRYCNYSSGKFGNEITVIEPCFWNPVTRQEIEQETAINEPYFGWSYVCEVAEDVYFDLIKKGATPQEARNVLPNSLKTELIMTTNLREWRHFFKLRTSSAAHPQMREIAVPLLKELQTKIPIVFDDIKIGGVD